LVNGEVPLVTSVGLNKSDSVKLLESVHVGVDDNPSDPKNDADSLITAELEKRLELL
jgi:hypothetical protein